MADTLADVKYKVAVATHPNGLRWRQLPDVEAALRKASAS